MPTPPYEDHLLAAPDVCGNCFRLIRQERVDPTRNSISRDFEESVERNPQTTVIGYGPSEAMSDSKGVFCRCGVEHHRDRVWSSTEIDRDRFKELLLAAVRTLVEKGVSLREKETIAYALQCFDDGASPDEAIATGVDAGIVAETAAASSSGHAPPAD